MFDIMRNAFANLTGKPTEHANVAPSVEPAAQNGEVRQYEAATDREAVYDFVRKHPASSTKTVYTDKALKMRTALVIAILEEGAACGDLTVASGAHGAKLYTLTRPLPEADSQPII